MWACPFCLSKAKQTNCCGKEACEHSYARFSNITNLWDHVEAKHPEVSFTLKENKDDSVV